jgi:hypothetical protein
MQSLQLLSASLKFKARPAPLGGGACANDRDEPSVATGHRAGVQKEEFDLIVGLWPSRLQNLGSPHQGFKYIYRYLLF